MGAPAFDPSQPFEEIDAPAFDPSKPHDVLDDEFVGPKYDGPVRKDMPASDAELAKMLEWARSNREQPFAQKMLTANDKRIGKTGNGVVDAAVNATLHGGDAGTLGFADEAMGALTPGDYKINRDKYRQILKARGDDFADEHPWLSAGSSILGSIPAAMAGPGYAGAIGAGALAGLGNSEAQDAKGMAVDTAIGGALGGAGQAVANGALAGGKWALGKGMEQLGKLGQTPEAALMKLRELFGHEAANVATAPVDAQAVRANQFADVMGDVAAANPRPVAKLTPADQLANRADIDAELPNINAVARQNNPAAAQMQSRVAPTDMQQLAHKRAIDQMLSSGGLELGADGIPRLPAPPRAQSAAMQPPQTNDVQAMLASINADAKASAERRLVGDTGVTKNVPRAAPDTAVMGNTEVGALKQRALVDNIAKVDDLMPYDSGAPIENWNASGKPRKNAIDVMSESADLGAPKAPAAEVQAIEQSTGPKSKRQAIIDAQLSNPDALAAFGVDPRKGERGFIGLGDAYAGVQALSKGVPAGAKLLAKGGAALESYGKQMSSPEQLTKSWLSNPSLLAPLAQRQDQMGAGARFVLEGLQAGGQDGLKSRLFVLQSQPWFRAMHAQQE